MPEKQVKVELVVPFIKATHVVFQSMIRLPIRRKDVYVKEGYLMYGDISAIIGMSGHTAGTCALSLPADLAVRVVGSLVGENVQGGVNDPEVRDGIGECVNMIAGHAKAALAGSKYHFDITLPTLISGKGHEIYYRPGARCIVIVFETEDHTAFTLDVCVAERK